MESSDVVLGNSIEYRIAVVEPGAHNRTCNRVRCLLVDKMSDVTECAYMIITGPDDGGDVLVEGELAVERHSENPESRTDWNEHTRDRDAT